jgi:hypothetical protein
MDELKQKPKRKSRIGRFFLILGIALLVAALALAAWYFLDRRSSFDYLPGKFRAYVQVPSLRRVYEEWIDLKAADAVLSSAGLEALRKGLVDFRGTQASQSAFIRSLIDVRADIMLLGDGSVLAVLDLGPRSLLSRLAPAAGPLLSIKNLSFTKKSNLSYFEYQIGGRSIYASPAGNLLILSTSPQALVDAFARKGGPDSFQARTDSALLKSLARSGQGLRFLADSGSLLGAPLSAFSQGKALLAAMSFPREGLADIELSNREAKLDIALSVESSLPELAQVISGRRSRSMVREILPSSTTFMVGINLPSLESLYLLAGALEPDLKKKLESASSASKLALGMSLEELVFSWSGGEAGIMQLDSSAKPVIYVSVRDEKKRAKVFEKLFASPLVSAESLEMDGSAMTRVVFPWYVKAAFDVAKIDIEAPYLAQSSGFLLLSQDPEALSACLGSIREGALLKSSTQALDGWDEAGLLYSFFDSNDRPFFLSGRDPVSAVLAQYGQGSLQAVPVKDGIEIHLHALPSASDRPVPLAGFPAKLNADIESFAIVRFPGRPSPRIVASGPKGAFIIDPSLPAKPNRLEGSSAIAAPSSGKFFWAQADSGKVYLYDSAGVIQNPFPREFKDAASMPPLALPAGLLLYSKDENGLMLVGESGEAKAWGPALEDPVLSRPVLSGGNLAFATKGFDSRLYLCGLDGKELLGWPQEAGGISFGSPALSSGPDRPLLAYLSQAGDLSLRDMTGDMAENFPVKLEGTFYASPLFVKSSSERLIACLNEDSRVSVTDAQGAERSSFLAPENAGKDARLAAYDVDRDGFDELFVYGSGGLVSGFALDGSPLPGFPLPGNLAVGFADMDNDGAIDLVSASRDGSVYAFTVKQRGGNQ